MEQNFPQWLIAVAAFITATGLIEISPIKINPWSWLAKQIGNALNSSVIEKIDKVEKKVEDVNNSLINHITNDEAETMRSYRTRILRFNDELIYGENKTKEYFDEMLDTIEKYKDYCDDHPDFPNGKTIMSIEHIEEVYKQKMNDNSFLSKEAKARKTRSKKTKED